MDAHSTFILMIANDRARDMRREAAELALSRAAGRRRPSLWARARGRAWGRREAGAQPVIPLPQPDAVELRRSA